MSNIAFHTVTLSAQLPEGTIEQWIHLLPRGRFSGRDGRGPWVADDLDRIIDNTRIYAGKTLLAVDYEHQTDLSGKNGQPAPAAGWIRGLQSRSDGLWGLVEWTQKAAAHIRAKEYRYISPVFNFAPGTHEVKRLLRAGLTNKPALDLTALASTQENLPMNEETLIRLRQLLGLDETADEAAIVDAVSSLVTAQQSTQPDPSAYVPIGEFKRALAEVQELRSRGTTENEARLMVANAIRNNRLPPAYEDWGVALCKHNKTAFEEFIEGIGPVFNTLMRGQITEEHRRYLDGLGGKKGKHALTHEQLAICDTMGIDPEDYAKQLGEQA